MTSFVENGPELFIGLAGPIGADLETVSDCIENALHLFKYETVSIRLTAVLEDGLDALEIELEKPLLTGSFAQVANSKINRANEFCEKIGSKDALASLAISEVINRRSQILGENGGEAKNTAFLFRQFKRPEEIEMMRRVYGRKFILISIGADAELQKSTIIKKIHEFNSEHIEDEKASQQALELIHRDLSEADTEFGQRLRDIFPLADFFVQSGNDQLSTEINRFFEVFFGNNGVSPTKDEYGMYIATAAALRSIDLSRQVGAAIFNTSAQIISMGCNEVPAPGGGTYWSDDEKPQRDFELGYDSNKRQKDKILHQLIEIIKLKASGDLLNSIDIEEIIKSDDIKGSLFSDIVEYGRIVHAEMNAITDAAREGRSVRGSTIYCTTFPCHLCAKHIISSGIDRLVYIEPYPKSKALGMYDDAIIINGVYSAKTVNFDAFMGISPRRYRDLFQKSKRKDKDGRALKYHNGKPFPMMEDVSASHINAAEASAVFVVFDSNRLKSHN